MTRGLFTFALMVSLALTAPAGAQEGDWQTVYDAGRAHLEKRETAEGLEALNRALEMAPAGMDRANTLYMLAAAEAQRQDFRAAAARLDEIIAYHDGGGFDDRDFLKTVLLRASMMAHQLKDREAAEAYAARRMEIDATNPDIWKIDQTADTYRHRATGLVYKPVVAGFERRSINVFKPNGTDVGGEYTMAAGVGEIRLIVYATQNIPLTGQQHLHSAVQTLRAEMNLPEKVGEGEFAPWGTDGPAGHYQIYRATRAATPTEVGLWVAADGQTHYKIRAAYPAASSGEARQAIEEFIEEFGWPAE